MSITYLLSGIVGREEATAMIIPIFKMNALRLGVLKFTQLVSDGSRIRIHSCLTPKSVLFP